MENRSCFISIESKDLNDRLSLGSQDESGWCGPASLLYAAHEQDLNNLPQQKDIAKAMGTTKEKGTSHKMMLEGSKILGLEGYWLEDTSLDEVQKLKEEGNSIILNWMDGRDPEEDGHYSLLIRCKEDLVYIQDPNFPERITVMQKKRFEEKNIWFDTCENKIYYHSALILKHPNQK
jgi:predicted double-glycine peptidase